MGNSINRILPIDLYHMVSVPELVLERALKIYHVKDGKGEALPSFETGTLAVICTGGSFSCKVNKDDCNIVKGQVLLAAGEGVTHVKSFIETNFSGIVVFVSEEFLINRQRLIIRDITEKEINEAMTMLNLIESQLNTPREIRAKVIESLLRALVIGLQYSVHEERIERDDIPPFFYDLALLISRYHHSPAYFYAEKLGLSSPEFNMKCRQYSQMTAVEWIADYVLLEAKDLLRKTRLRPSQIAIMLGFSNQDTFSRWFRRLTGEFPSEWK